MLNNSEQFLFDISAHAEELRSIFVSHYGQKQLIAGTLGNCYNVDFGKLANLMFEEMKKSVGASLLARSLGADVRID